jgi:hypothetical protein
LLNLSQSGERSDRQREHSVIVVERDDDLFPGLQVFHPNHTAGVSRLQNLRGQQSELLPVTISSRYAVYGNLELRSCHCG